MALPALPNSDPKKAGGGERLHAELVSPFFWPENIAYILVESLTSLLVTVFGYSMFIRYRSVDRFSSN